MPTLEPGHWINTGTQVRDNQVIVRRSTKINKIYEFPTKEAAEKFNDIYEKLAIGEIKKLIAEMEKRKSPYPLGAAMDYYFGKNFNKGKIRSISDIDKPSRGWKKGTIYKVLKETERLYKLKKDMDFVESVK